MRTGHPVGPTQRPNGLEARNIINEILNVQHHPCSGARWESLRIGSGRSTIRRGLECLTGWIDQRSPKRWMSH